VRVQAVLPGATATDFWDTAGKPLEDLPDHILMRTEDLVDAALNGLDRGELVTIPSLPEQAEWDAYDNARRYMAGHLSSSRPAARYRT
jgi:short-subunit dehydrogenase